MPIQLIITGENAHHATMELRNFAAAMQFAPVDAPKEEPVATDVEVKKPVKKAAKPAPVVEYEEEEAPKAKAKKPVVEEDEDEAPAPKKAVKKAAKPAPVEEDEEEEAPKPKAKAKTEGKSSVGELVDDGEEQPPTTDGCRIMIRRVARAAGCGTEHAQAILAEFGVTGATKIVEKKMQSFINRCQEVIDDPEAIEIEAE